MVLVTDSMDVFKQIETLRRSGAVSGNQADLWHVASQDMHTIHAQSSRCGLGQGVLDSRVSGAKSRWGCYLVPGLGLNTGGDALEARIAAEQTDDPQLGCRGSGKYEDCASTKDSYWMYTRQSGFNAYAAREMGSHSGTALSGRATGRGPNVRMHYGRANMTSDIGVRHKDANDAGARLAREGGRRG